MSYLNRAQDPRRRSAAIVGVAAIHALLALGLIKGLDVDFEKIVSPRLGATNVPLDPPPPPPPQPDKPQPVREQTFTAPLPPLDLRPVNPVEDVVVQPPVFEDTRSGVDTNQLVLPTPKPTVAATFTPKAARPTNRPASWVSTDDYPRQPLMNGIEGTAGYSLVIGTNGKVSSCEITASSGNRALDQATCRFIASRARFDPATDENGAKVLGSYSGTVRWTIPD